MRKSKKNKQKKTYKRIKPQKNEEKKIDINSKPIASRKICFMTLIFLIIAVCLVVRIGYIQFFQTHDGVSLKELASRQQTVNEVISPKRGSIYDTNGKALAVSASVDTISINPKKIKDENKEKVATALSDIFELDYEDTLNKVKSESSVVTIAKKIEQDKVSQLQKWMSDNKLTAGININEDTKRYYPYGSLASHVIGFTGTDGQGLYGIESKWQSTLQGVSGKIVTVADGKNKEISADASQYVAVENGSDLYLTLDVNIQSILEKYLEKGVSDAKASAGSVIAMNPKTGDILGMASYPYYDLNSPFTLVSNYETKDMSSEDRAKSLYTMWSDKNVNTTYEPGSTFKTIMSAIALEENITIADNPNDFSCPGYIEVADRRIRCASHEVHGTLSLKKALANSCNVAFIQLGQRIGTSTLYKYFSAFGLFEKTGIALPGESSSVFHDEKAVGPVELATTSFGQRFEITPLQLITAVSSIANGGTLMQPRIVKQVINTNTENKTITNLDTVPVRTVISKETADEVCKMMEYVVTDGSGKKGAVKGYYIGGKTGTSESTYSSNGNRYDVSSVSYIAIAPYNDAEISILVVLYDPQVKSSYGSTLVAPIVGNMLSEILPYMGIAAEGTSSGTSSSNELISVPDIKNKTITEATKILQNAGFKVNYSGNEDANSTIVKEQVPAADSKLYSNSTVILYTAKNRTRTSVNVPDLTGLSLAQARSTLSSLNLNLKYVGSGTVSSQDIEKDTSVEEGSVITVTLK